MRSRSVPPPRTMYSWKPRREKDFQHPACSFKTGERSGTFVVNPEWVSEEMHPRQPFGGRRWKPWPYEFHGARHFPYGTVEQLEEEEQATRQMIEENPMLQEVNPIMPEERPLVEPNVRLYIMDSSSKPKMHIHGSRSYSTSASRGLPKIEYSRFYDALDSARSDRPEYYRDPNNLDISEYEDHKQWDVPYTGRDGRPIAPLAYAGSLSKYDPVVRPTDLKITPEDKRRAMLLRKSVEFNPKDGRPRMDRPYMNLANAHWI